MRDALQVAAVDANAVHVVGPGLFRVRAHIEPAPVGGQCGSRHLELTVSELAYLAVQRLGIELREAGFLGHVPQRAAVVFPAEFVEVPVDPGAVVQAFLQRRLWMGGSSVTSQRSLLSIARSCTAACAPSRENAMPAISRSRVFSLSALADLLAFASLSLFGLALSRPAFSFSARIAASGSSWMPGRAPTSIFI